MTTLAFFSFFMAGCFIIAIPLIYNFKIKNIFIFMLIGLTVDIVAGYFVIPYVIQHWMLFHCIQAFKFYNNLARKY